MILLKNLLSNPFVNLLGKTEGQKKGGIVKRIGGGSFSANNELL